MSGITVFPSMGPGKAWHATTVLTLGLSLVCGLPSYLGIAALGPAGKPGALLFLGALLWWVWVQLQRPFPMSARINPVRLIFFMFLAAILLSYALSTFSAIPTREGGLADGGLLKALSWSGIVLVASDGISDRGRLLTMCRRVVLIASLMALLGLAQLWSGQSLVSTINIPGLATDTTFDNIQSRAGFTRAAATASHPLEYATVLSMALPVACVLATYDVERARLRRWTPVVLIALAGWLSVSRSALVGLFIGLAVLALSWTRKARVLAVIAATAGFLATYLFVPGMIGTIRGLFLGLGNDSSANSRTNSLVVALDIAGRGSPLGRGFGTFLPEYQILDNQYLGLFIETGVIGLLTFISLIAAGAFCCLRVRKKTADPLLRNVSYGIFASVLSGAVTAAFFDALAFPISAAFLFLFIGLAGAIWTIAGTTSDTSVKAP
ncbi:O-antigen ligase family protein [Pseudarthrobacter niigatensis]|uniref:O-antigen ligase-related domain-containing protein n=1 Tax=Pseudarthrobacter niigatensis TaxID=369935 RepID=A0AAJ1WIN5_9MICC|nr:O-antigen ligase family protein [Pseudarthrobacter niigatensis]MDQ0147748.1 hypothetical protein [Pseudarthrobacter niigatensis]MDQ0267621.1 hypothetical protein [Pseudarthrobacter niigatensis]